MIQKSISRINRLVRLVLLSLYTGIVPGNESVIVLLALLFLLAVGIAYIMEHPTFLLDFLKWLFHWGNWW